jgi:hypothetical protein
MDLIKKIEQIKKSENTKLNFDEFKKAISEIEVPAQKTGIFNIFLNYKGKKYFFAKLKENYTCNPDYCGFGLNNYGRLGLPMPRYKKSKFHDSEYVSIPIKRSEFIFCLQSENQFYIKTKNWFAVVDF